MNSGRFLSLMAMMLKYFKDFLNSNYINIRFNISYYEDLLHLVNDIFCGRGNVSIKDFAKTDFYQNNW